MFATMAVATGNPVYQWFYLQHGQTSIRTDLCQELLTYDPSVIAQSPEGRIPHGRGFRGHGACWSSRTDWNPRSTACVVYGKGGHGCELHGNHDAGTVCIDGYARPLITDPGSLHYPSDFFGPERYEYYNASAWGHNVPVFGGREMRSGRWHETRILDMKFQDTIGAAWLGDSTFLYGGVDRVRRGVIHLLPGIVAVLDACDLRTDEETSIRWHTADRAEADKNGCFTVENQGVRLAARVCSLTDAPLTLQRGEQSYIAPFDRNRLGNLLEQKHESFVEALIETQQVRILSLFSVYGPESRTSQWKKNDDHWSIEAEGGTATVIASGTMMTVRSSDHSISLDIEEGTVSLQ